MPHSFLQFEYSPWLITICLLVAASGTYLLYFGDSGRRSNIEYLLMTLRFVCLFVLSVLLLDPVLNRINNTIEKPTYVIGIDNSASITAALDSVSVLKVLGEINTMKTALEAAGCLVEFRTLSGHISENSSDVSFDGQTTNIDNFLKSLQSDYEGRNLAGVVLVSDGIYNQGMSPLYATYTFPIHTIGIGNTIAKNDLSIQDLKYNKTSYQGNDFPIIATIGNKGYEGNSEVRLLHKGKIIESKSIVLSANEPVTQVLFQTEAIESGLQKFKIEVATKDDEYNTVNNSGHAYVDIVDGKERILLIATAPHPDIKALSSSIGVRKNYELITYIPGIHKEKPEGKFDLVIYHQLPDRGKASEQLMKQYHPKDTPSLFLPALRSTPGQISSTLDYISMRKLSDENAQVTAAFNQDFTYFSLSEALQTTLNQLPPLEVSRSEISVSAGSSPLLYQRMRGVITQKPLLLINVIGDLRSGLLLGEGIWRWKLYEYNQNGNSDGFDELVLKLVQYLTTKTDKRKFRCSPLRNQITTAQPLIFETEIYNDLFELIYGQTVRLELTGESADTRAYSFTNTKGSNRYQVNGLPTGIYQYSATTNINNTSQTVRGELVITREQIEHLNTTADHHLLGRLAGKNNGTFHLADDFPSAEQLSLDKAGDILHSAESFSSLINSKWLFFFFLVLLSAEWCTRKYHGPY